MTICMQNRTRVDGPLYILRSVVKTILNRPDWRVAMRTTYTVRDRRGNEVPESPLRLLIRVFPDLAEQVFDQCVTQVGATGSGHGGTHRPGSPTWRQGSKVRMDYEFVEDAFHYDVTEDPSDKESE
jgi:hypothetical protein